MLGEHVGVRRPALDLLRQVREYVEGVAPHLADRVEKWSGDGDVFANYRIDEQIKKALDRKVWLPSGGSLIIDRTEAMTVVDVNTGKFTGSGGNLEETVTKNNLEAAEEIVRQLRLRDIGGIIVVDFIDMVLESNRDLVLRRLVECLGRDRTRHQVAEVTSLGLVQMTRKRIGTGLLESFSHDCPHCHGRGVIIEDAPVEPKKGEDEPRRARRNRSRGRTQETSAPEPPKPPSPKDLAAMARHHEEHPEDRPEDLDDLTDDLTDDITEDGAEDLEDLTEDLTGDRAEDQAPDDVEPLDDGAETSQVEVAAETAEDDVQVEVSVEVASASAPEPPAEPEPVTPAEPERPRVVTRTRRRSASRPAGPPTSAPADSGGPAAGADGTPEQPADETPALHVPVKRKGARKR